MVRRRDREEQYCSSLSFLSLHFLIKFFFFFYNNISLTNTKLVIEKKERRKYRNNR